MHTYFEVSAGVAVGVTFPDTIPRHAGLHPSQIPFLVRSTTLPAESIFMGWQPSYPTQIWPSAPLPAAIRVGTSFAADVEQAVAPTAWWPRYPDAIPRRDLPTALHPTYFLPPQGELLEIAARQSWKPRFPDRLDRARPRLEGGAFWTIPPFVPAAEHECVELIDDSFGVPALINQVFTVPSLLDEGLTVPQLVEQDLC